MPPKRHHYVPEAYLKAFCAGDGRLTVYRKSEPERPFRTTPGNVALEGFYYAFTREDGSKDSESLERLFSNVERSWPRVVDALRERRADPAVYHDLLVFVALQRARVPAVRDAYELMRADTLLGVARMMERQGLLPPLPVGVEPGLLDRVDVAIDPEASLQAIGLVLDGVVERVFPKLSFSVVRNETSLPFITSDNPVAWFVPYKNESRVAPYEMLPGAPLELLFPITPHLMLVGLSTFRLARNALHFAKVAKVGQVKRMNRLVAKFAYEALFCLDSSSSTLVRKYSDIVPTLHTTEFSGQKSSMFKLHMEFAPRRRKVRWRGGAA